MMLSIDIRVNIENRSDTFLHLRFQYGLFPTNQIGWYYNSTAQWICQHFFQKDGNLVFYY